MKIHFLYIELREVCTLTVVPDTCCVGVNALRHGPVFNHSLKEEKDEIQNLTLIWDYIRAGCDFPCHCRRQQVEVGTSSSRTVLYLNILE